MPPRFYVLLATLEVPSEALLHPQKSADFRGPQLIIKNVPYEKETNYLLFTSRRYSGELRTYLL